MNLDILTVVTTITAFAMAGTKLFSKTLPFWGSWLPPTVSRFLPGFVLVIGALPAALSGVTTWMDFGIAFLGAFALALPGTHKNAAAPLPEPKDPSQGPSRPITMKPPPNPPMVAMLTIALFGCAGGQGTGPCSATDAEMLAHAAECKARVERECDGIPDSECAVTKECDQWGESRCGGAK